MIFIAPVVSLSFSFLLSVALSKFDALLYNFTSCIDLFSFDFLTLFPSLHITLDHSAPLLPSAILNTPFMRSHSLYSITSSGRTSLRSTRMPMRIMSIMSRYIFSCHPSHHVYDLTLYTSGQANQAFAARVASVLQPGDLVRCMITIYYWSRGCSGMRCIRVR